MIDEAHMTFKAGSPIEYELVLVQVLLVLRDHHFDDLLKMLSDHSQIGLHTLLAVYKAFVGLGVQFPSFIFKHYKAEFKDEGTLTFTHYTTSAPWPGHLAAAPCSSSLSARIKALEA